MKKFLNVLKQVALYVWQLPQNIIGLIVIFLYKPTYKHIMDNGVEIHYSNSMSGGISLGKYSVVHTYHYKKDINESLERDTVKHEAVGHTRQSRMLGPLYLIVIGLPSIIWAGLYGSVVPITYNGYYRFYTERWADKLAGIKRYGI